MRPENGPQLTRREFGKLLAAGAVVITTGGSAKLIKDFTTDPDSINPHPYVEDNNFPEFLRTNQVTFTLHDAAEDSEKTDLVLNNPKIIIPEINVSSSYGRLFSAHHPDNIEWLISGQHEERELDKVFDTFANAGINKFEFDLKEPFDFDSFISFIDFLSHLKEEGIVPIVSGSFEWVSRLPDFQEVIPKDTETIPTLRMRHEVNAYKRNLESGWGNNNSGATINNRSKYRDEIIRLNQTHNRPTKLYGIKTETDVTDLRSEQETIVKGVRIIIGTDDARLIQRGMQAA